MPAARRDLLPDDDLDAHPARLGHRARGVSSVNPLVVRDGDHVEAGSVLRVVEDRGYARDSVGREAVDVEVCASHQLLPPAMSSQMGKKSVHHCSGASAMTLSNAAISALTNPSSRSRGLPVVGTWSLTNRVRKLSPTRRLSTTQVCAPV